MPLHRKKRRALFTAAAALLISPVTILSAVSLLPSADEIILTAATASAQLAAGGTESPRTVTEIPAQTTAVSQADAVSLPVMVNEAAMLSRGELIMPHSENEELTVPETEAEPEPYPLEADSRDGVIAAMTYGIMSGDSYIALKNGGQVRNVTSVPNDTLLQELEKPLDLKLDLDGEPQILIMHTHETESYEPYERDFYDKSFACRTTDDSMNMAAVGDAIAKQLEDAGIAVIHDVTKHDHPSCNGSYDRSRVTVQNILEQYPSVKIVLDIHRDAIERSDGTRISPVAEINGRNAAQVMIISGCDDGTMDMPDCMSNFRFACALQQQLESDHPGRSCLITANTIRI